MKSRQLLSCSMQVQILPMPPLLAFNAAGNRRLFYDVNIHTRGPEHVIKRLYFYYESN